MSFRLLSELFPAGRPKDAPVATVAGAITDFDSFARHVAWNAAALRKIGCRRGLLLARDSYWGAVGMMALHQAGAIAIFPSSLHPTDVAPFACDCVVADEPVSFAGDQPIHLCLLEAGKGDPADLRQLSPRAATLELYTAGSTGHPKRVTKSLADMELEAAAIDAAFGNARPTAVFATVPYHHLYGLTFRLAWPLCAGLPIVGKTYQYWEELARDMTPDAVVVTSPAHLTRLPTLDTIAWNRAQRVLSAGAAFPDQAARDAVAVLGVPITDIFGSTETGVIAYRTLNGNPAHWRHFPGVEIRQLADDRLAVRSPYTSQDTKDGWYETADIIDVLPGGVFQLRGRSDQIVKIEGNRVSLLEIERLLGASSLVETAAVVSLTGEPVQLGAALVLTAEGRRVLRETGPFRLGRRLRQELARVHESAGLPRRWRFVDQLPEAILGKRRRAEIASLFAVTRAPTDPEVRQLRVVNDGVELDLFIPDSLLQLRGHFPDLPVVPGVALIDWAVRYAREHLSAPNDAGRSFQIKFRRIVTAPSLITLALAKQTELNRIQFEYRQGDNILSVGAFKLRAP